tara:strand:- start:11463 stop:12128 length:666 start_codon:yes stop_codon:yes gene_type:complete
MWSYRGTGAPVKKYYRVAIDLSGYPSGTATTAGGVTPNPSRVDGVKYYYNTAAGDSSSVRNSTLPTTNATVLERERGNIRWENVVRQLQKFANCEIFDIEIIEANGDANATSLQFSVAYETPEALAIGGTSVDGSTAINDTTLIKELVVIGICLGTGTGAAGSNSVKEIRKLFLPQTGNGESQATEVTCTNPVTFGQAYDDVTVTVLGQTLISDVSTDPDD